MRVLHRANYANSPGTLLNRSSAVRSSIDFCVAALLVLSHGHNGKKVTRKLNSTVQFLFFICLLDPVLFFPCFLLLSEPSFSLLRLSCSLFF